MIARSGFLTSASVTYPRNPDGCARRSCSREVSTSAARSRWLPLAAPASGTGTTSAAGVTVASLGSARFADGGAGRLWLELTGDLRISREQIQDLAQQLKPGIASDGLSH